VRAHSPGIYIAAAAALVVLMTSYNLLSPVLLSFLLVVLITLAANPVVLRIRELTGGRRLAAGLVTAAFVIGLGLTLWPSLLRSRLDHKARPTHPGILGAGPKAADASRKAGRGFRSKAGEGSHKRGGAKAAAQGEQQHAQKALRESSTGQKTPAGFCPLGSHQHAARNGGRLQICRLQHGRNARGAGDLFFSACIHAHESAAYLQSIFALVPEQHHEQALRIFRRIAEFVPNWALRPCWNAHDWHPRIPADVAHLRFYGCADPRVIAGVLEAIPYIGPTLSAVPGLLLALGKGGMTPLWVLLAYVAVQVLENNVILPLIMARA